MKIEHDYIRKVGELVLEGVNYVSMVFSIDGSKFAIFYKER